MCAKYYENPTMLSRVIAKNVGDVFFETHCIYCVCTYVSVSSGRTVYCTIKRPSVVVICCYVYIFCNMQICE